MTAESVRAIIAGNQTQTRRVVKPQPTWLSALVLSWNGRQLAFDRINTHIDGGRLVCNSATPYGVPGDRLWVRETWNIADPEAADEVMPDDIYGPRAPFTGVVAARPILWRAIYKANSPPVHPVLGKALWRSPLHMPRWASRLTLEVVAVRVERLQEISEADAMAEGITGPHFVGHAAYQIPGDSKARYSRGIRRRRPRWASNPWVWVVEFRRVKP